jgi:hypothetical protein
MPSSLSDLKFVSSVAERDIDFIILEELEVSAEFRAWFSTRVYETPVFKKQIGAWHSVSDAKLGESDLIYLFEAEDGSRKAVLIENKIDAPPQADQGSRYRQRGEEGGEDGSWDEFRTCIIAPRKYLGSPRNSEIYDAEVSYEEIMAHFVGRGVQNARLAYRAKVIQEGIEKNRRGYQQKISEPMTNFVNDYVAYVRENYPDLCVQDAKPRAEGSTWIHFYPKGKPKNVQVLHQVDAGFIKVFLSGMVDQLEALREKYADKPIADLEVQSTGKSVALAVPVPGIDPIKRQFSESLDHVSEAMSGLTELVALAKSRGDI